MSEYKENDGVRCEEEDVKRRREGKGRALERRQRR